MPLCLTDFRVRAAEHTLAQSASLDWLAALHARARATAAREGGEPFDEEAYRAVFRRRLERFGCTERSVRQRGHELDDAEHLRWDEMEVYRANEEARGAGPAKRTRVFDDAAGRAFDELYRGVDAAPEQLLHVTCTGYAAPSAAQRFVGRRGWGAQTRVTHVYHMGCYAALPAVQLATGVLSCPDTGPRRVDVVHTEMCSLHIDPLADDPEQLVIQSLFADGFIRYSVTPRGSLPRGANGLEVVAQQEWTLPRSEDLMSWSVGDHGMQMRLSRALPERLREELPAFLDALARRAHLGALERRDALYAIHPGGPRILDACQEQLGLSPAQLEASRRVLRERGNLSSATLPHIWGELAASEEVARDELIVTFGFGPGVTISGAVLRKVTA